MNNQLREVIFSGIVSVRDRLLQLDKPLRLESGEPSFDTPKHIKEAMAKALVDNHQFCVGGYIRGIEADFYPMFAQFFSSLLVCLIKPFVIA